MKPKKKKKSFQNACSSLMKRRFLFTKSKNSFFGSKLLYDIKCKKKPFEVIYLFYYFFIVNMLYL
jgi:hypothetical protein